MHMIPLFEQKQLFALAFLTLRAIIITMFEFLRNGEDSRWHNVSMPIVKAHIPVVIGIIFASICNGLSVKWKKRQIAACDQMISTLDLLY